MRAAPPTPRRAARRTLTAGIVTLLVAAGLVGTAAGPAVAVRPCPPLQIGLLARFEGPDASIAAAELTSARLAVDGFTTENPDCPVTVLPLDAGADGNAAGDAIRAAAEDPRLVAVIGPQRSGDTLVVGPLLEYLGLPFISMSATRPDLSEQGWRTFHRIVASDVVQGAAAARWITRTLHAKKVGVVDDGTPYGAALAAEVRAGLGSTPVVTAHLAPDQTDLSSAVNALSGLGPDDVVYYAGYDVEGARLLTALRAAGSTVRFAGGDGLPTEAFIAGAGPAGEGVLITCPCAPPDRLPRARGFVDRYTAATGSAPQLGSWTVETYDATDLVLTVIGEGAHTRATVGRGLDRIRRRGVLGTHRFDARGDVMAPTVWVYRVSGGRLVADEPITGSTRRS